MVKYGDLNKAHFSGFSILAHRLLLEALGSFLFAK